MLKRRKIKDYLMGTQINVDIVSNIADVDIDNVLIECINIFHRVVTKFTRFNSNSELSKLNLSNGKFVDVSKEMFDLIKFGVGLGKITNNIFDITVIDFLETYGYGPNYNFENLNNPKLYADIENLLRNRPNPKDIVLDAENLQIKLMPTQRIDLGSFGKGYAIKLTRDYLIQNDFDNFLINAGGDICANGVNEKNNLWEIGMFEPDNSKTLNLLKLPKLKIRNSSIASSGAYARKIKNFHHLIDTKIGKPKFIKDKLPKSVFIKAKNPMIADALATVIFLNINLEKKLKKSFDFQIIK